jgi:hypothetical protein
MSTSKRVVVFLCGAAAAFSVMSALAGIRNPSEAPSTSILIDEYDSSPAFAPVTGIRTYFGGYGHSVFPVPGGGIMVAGTWGAGFACCQPWLIRMNAVGTPLWQLVYDAPGLAGANNMQPASDGGWVIAGEGLDLLAFKVDAAGVVVWAKNYGPGGGTHCRVFPTSAGDYLLLGGTTLEDDGFNGNGRVLRLDQDGNILWQRVLGEFGVNEYFTSAAIAHNGNMVIAGASGGDYWVLEMDLSGNVVWEKSYGGPMEDDAWTITGIRDGFYMVVGSSDSYAAGGLRNWWALLLSQTGQLLAQRSLGGPDAEDPNVVIGTSDGGAMIGGGTGSFGAGFSDIWLVKFGPRGNIQWQKTYGVNRTDHAWHIQELQSGGYIVIGDSYMYPAEYDVWLMAIDANGNVQYGACGEISDTNVIPFATGAAAVSLSSPVFDPAVMATDLPVNALEQPFPIEDCTPVQ